jgi:hypothetical protein
MPRKADPNERWGSRTGYRIFVYGLADGTVNAVSNAWVKSMDFEAFAGRGHLVTTDHPSRAKVFPTFTEAAAYYRTRSVHHPDRTDGKPNRPLTAYTIVIEPVP